MPEEFFNEHQNPLPRRPESLLTDSTRFRGDRNHLEAFARLISTPIRQASRSAALHEWKAYNRVPTYNSRGKAIKGYPRFRGIDLRGIDLHDVYIGYVDLRGARLDDADLRGVRMKGAWLDGASLEGAKLDGGYFAFASFAHARLVNVSARGANFREAKLIGTDFSRSDLTGALLADTQRRDWNLHGVLCDYVYWNISKQKTTYRPGEFETFFSQETMVSLESGRNMSTQELSTLPMLVEALKKYHGAVLRLQSVEDSNGKALIRFKVEDSAGLTKDDLRSVAQEFFSDFLSKGDIIFQNNIHTVSQLVQAGTIQHHGKGEHVAMANFTTNISGSVGSQVMAENANFTMGNINVAGEVPIEPKTAKMLEAIVVNQNAETPGFSDELKGEILGALKSIALEQAKALPKRIYSLLKEFFPSYVKPFLP